MCAALAGNIGGEDGVLDGVALADEEFAGEKIFEALLKLFGCKAGEEAEAAEVDAEAGAARQLREIDGGTDQIELFHAELTVMVKDPNNRVQPEQEQHDPPEIRRYKIRIPFVRATPMSE